jgi:hypothetical protein
MVKQGFSFSLRERLKRPYVMAGSVAPRWRTCLLYSSFVFLFLAIFQPFGLSELPKGILTVSLGYGLTTLLVMAVLNIALPPLFPAYFSEDRWTVGREITWSLLNIGGIGLANLLYSRSVLFFPFSLKALLVMEGFTLAVGIFPIVVSTLLKEARLTRKYEQRSETMNQTLSEQASVLKEVPASAHITIPSENAGESFSLAPEEFLYIRSADNYLEIFYTGRQGTERKVIRNSLKAVSAALGEHAYLFRCHKSYLVNLKQVNHVSGNAQGYKLHLRGLDQPIPVSRQWNEEIKTRLAGSP